VHMAHPPRTECRGSCTIRNGAFAPITDQGSPCPDCPVQSGQPPGLLDRTARAARPISLAGCWRPACPWGPGPPRTGPSDLP
jgi:hypothetical protein